eukprot:scaffold942_cov75-Skeletonema_dohrnii-CCMP3373.AAC.5
MSDKSVCASCGIAEVKLKECDDCDLVKYCSDACKQDHKSQHKEACNKRAAELRDEILFKQPESTHLGDCPICCIPLPLDVKKSGTWVCCSKTICMGCALANNLREEDVGFKHTCPFCRAICGESDKKRMKRIEANDPVAMCREGLVQDIEGDYSSAFELYTKAAELGDLEAHYQLSLMYDNGYGVEKDKEKEKMHHHLEEAAIGGHPSARFNLGCHEWNNGNTERAVKHWIIAATQGHDGSINELMDEFRNGMVSKDDLAAALRAHQAAVGATKSPQREAAEEYYRIEDNSHAEC